MLTEVIAYGRYLLHDQGGPPTLPTKNGSTQISVSEVSDPVPFVQPSLQRFNAR